MEFEILKEHKEQGLDRNITLVKEHNGTYSIYGFAQYELFGMRVGRMKLTKLGTVHKKDFELNVSFNPLLESLTTRTMGDILSKLKYLGEQTR